MYEFAFMVLMASYYLFIYYKTLQPVIKLAKAVTKSILPISLGKNIYGINFVHK